MSGYMRRGFTLFDAVTNKVVGFVDGRGREQLLVASDIDTATGATVQQSVTSLTADQATQASAISTMGAAITALQAVPPGTVAYGAPVARTVALGTAYQATTSAKSAIVSVNLSSVSTNSLLSTTAASQKGEVWIGATAAAVTGTPTGTRIALHENSQAGVLVVGLTITQTQAQQVVFALPAGWFFSVRQTAGSALSVVSAFDQVAG